MNHYTSVKPSLNSFWVTLVPEVFLDISPHERVAREPQSGEHESRSGEKEKPLVTLDLNLTFMQTPGSGSDPRIFYKHGFFTNTQINSIGPFDWQYRGDGGDICYCVYLYQRKKSASKILCSTLILFRTVPSKEFDLCARGAFSID